MIIFIAFFTFFGARAQETLELLRFNLLDSEKVIYSIEKPEECSFVNSDIAKGIMYNSENNSFKKFNFLEKIYFKIKNVKKLDQNIKLELSLASNTHFIFSYKKCSLQKNIVINEKSYPFEKIEVFYKDALGAPVLDYFKIKDDKNERTLYQHALKGHLPLYELKVGPAVSIRTNFRPDNRRIFRRTNPTIQPIPAFIFRYGNLFINKDGAGAAFLASEGLTALFAAIRDGEPYERPGIKERRNGIMLGPIFNYNNLQVRYMKNWFDKEKGSELKVSYSYEFRPTNDLHIIPRVYLQAWDTRYSDYYVGVDPDETAFQPYEGRRSLNYSSMMRILYFDERIIYLADFGFKFLDKKIYRSPIVSTKVEWRATLGVLYRVF